jgi:hypothetical protein
MDPLPKASIAKLLNMSTSDLDGVLDYLHSVLKVPSGAISPIQLFHLSFHDFLVDQDQCDADFWIDEKGTHERTATRCIEVMSANGELRENIWGLEYPGKLRSEVSSDTIDIHLSAELRYACRYWVEHLRRSGRSIRDNDDVHCFLQKHTLHLLEALGMLGKISESIHMIATLQSLLSVRLFDHVMRFHFLTIFRPTKAHSVPLFSMTLNASY